MIKIAPASGHSVAVSSEIERLAVGPCAVPHRTCEDGSLASVVVWEVWVDGWDGSVRANDCGLIQEAITIL